MRELLLLGLCVISLPIILRNPFWGLCIYLAANIIRPEMLFWGGYSGSYIFSILYGLTILSTLINGHFAKISELLRKEFLLLAWMATALYCSIFFSRYYIDTAYYFSFELIKILGICSLIYMLAADFAHIQRLQTVMIGCFTFLGLWGIEQQFLGNERLEGLGGYAWGDSNGVAAVFVLFTPVALAKAISSQTSREKWVSYCMAAIIVALIVCTKSRGGVLGLVVCLLSFGFYSQQFAKTIKLAIILALIVSPFLSGTFFDRIKTMKNLDSEQMESSAKSRIVLWQAGLMVFADNPILGTGFMTYPEAKMEYENRFSDLDPEFREWVFREEDKKVTHNTYIQMLSECGIAGALPFFLLIGGGIFTGFQARHRLEKRRHDSQLIWLSGIAAGLTGFAVCMLTINTLLIVFLYVQLVCAASIARAPYTSPKI